MEFPIVQIRKVRYREIKDLHEVTELTFQDQSLGTFHSTTLSLMT